MTKIIQPTLIFNEITIGKGIDGDPIRTKTEILSADGELLLDYDPLPDSSLNHEKYCIERLPEKLLKLSA